MCGASPSGSGPAWRGHQCWFRLPAECGRTCGRVGGCLEDLQCWPSPHTRCGTVGVPLGGTGLGWCAGWVGSVGEYRGRVSGTNTIKAGCQKQHLPMLGQLGRKEMGKTNGARQRFHLQRPFQHIPAPPALTLKLVSGSPSRVSQVPVKPLSLCWLLGRVRLCRCPSRAGSRFPTALQLSRT